MPYYLHPKDVDPSIVCDWTVFESCDNRAEAHRRAQVLGAYKVSYVESTEDRVLWHNRESTRFAEGAYQDVPWYAANYPDHYVHLSTEHPGQVAYTPDAEHGYQDRQVRLNPGKYLERFYADASQETRAKWIAACTVGNNSLQIATTADDIERVYRGKDYNGAIPFRSCMGPDAHSYFRVHPTRVYGDSDLAVAYLGEIDAVKARCVVWPAKKVYSRVYGSDRLEVLLESAGYSEGDVTGAKVRAIPFKNGDAWLMPYIDGVNEAEDLGNGYLRLGEGEIAIDTTDGYVEVEQRMTCQHCERECPYNDDSSYCGSCEEDRQFCEKCEEDYWGDSQYVAELDEHVCDGCAEGHTESECKHCGDTWNEWTLDREVQERREGEAVIGRICPACEPLVMVCHSCREIYATGEYCSCGVPPRCERTGDLLAPSMLAPEPEPTYRCGDQTFPSLVAASDYAANYFRIAGVVLAVESQVV